MTEPPSSSGPSAAFHSRYEPIALLGRGGGGSVWAVRDRVSGTEYAAKTLGEGAGERETLALVREASALSGLEGLGVPKVQRFGRLPQSGAPYLLRELVAGQSLAEALAEQIAPMEALHAWLAAADQLTVLHRAGLLHGDVKPANVIVGAGGGATLVDLGLAVAWNESGQRPIGLTPQYAAPEVMAGRELTVRSEVFALGQSLSEILSDAAGRLPPGVSAELQKVAQRATAHAGSERYPSSDELAATVRNTLGIPTESIRRRGADVWPIVGLDDAVASLLAQTAALEPGGVLEVRGPSGCGRSALLQRLAWSLGIEGTEVAWIAQHEPNQALAIVELELEALQRPREGVLVVDDLQSLPDAALQAIWAHQGRGARVICTATVGGPEPSEVFDVPPLAEGILSQLAARALPSLGEALVGHLVRRSEGVVGRLRRDVRLLDGVALASAREMDEVLEARQDPGQSMADPLERAEYYLAQNRLLEAQRAAKDFASPNSPLEKLFWARLAYHRGDLDAAEEYLSSVSPPELEGDARDTHRLYMVRLQYRRGDYGLALETAKPALGRGRASSGPMAETRCVAGLCDILMGEHKRAERRINRAICDAQRIASWRVVAVARGSLAFLFHRLGELPKALSLYQQALEDAERVNDVGLLANTRMNLAALNMHGKANLPQALAHLEASVELARLTGNDSTMVHAMLNLANLDIYLGRTAKATAAVHLLQEQRSPAMRVGGRAAQLLGLRAELAVRRGELDEAGRLYGECADAYSKMGRHADGAEAQIESVLVFAQRPGADVSALRVGLANASAALSEHNPHAAALYVAKGAVAMLAGAAALARSSFQQALKAAEQAQQREWVWRAHGWRARLEHEVGKTMEAREHRQEAVRVLEDLAADLPPDLREVYWNEPRRRQLRHFAHSESQATFAASETVASPTRWGALQEDRLGLILEINRDLAMFQNLDQVLQRVLDHAIRLLDAERGYVILIDEGGDLSVRASQNAGREEQSRQAFSKTVAQRAIDTGEPIVSLQAREDERMSQFASVHELALQSVACVPIRDVRGGVMGALYLETRSRQGRLFRRELHTLHAFADQVAIAINNIRLLDENAARTGELEQANRELSEARAKLEELLDRQKAELIQTTKTLKSTRAVLDGRFGYRGLVGTSNAMRRLYALIDRVTDTDVPVLIIGESGTGKELVAKAIHQGGARSGGPFSPINCGAIPQQLLESELFGHVKGAFTGAEKERKGLFRQSQGGTVLLDEIGEMPTKMQAGLLRLLQEKSVRPVGGVREERIDVRVVAATHRDLPQLIEEGHFRQDLYYRLRVVEIHVPALRQRPDDIPTLIDHFLELFATRYQRDKGSVSRGALRMLTSYHWPGNVRQLENALLNAWVLAEHPELQVDDFELSGIGATSARASAGPISPRPSSVSSSPAAPARTLEEHRSDEKFRILAALEASGWNRVKAASALQMPRRTFYRRLKQYGIQ